MPLPNCLDCKYGGRAHPCRTAAGEFDFAKAAAAYMARGREIAKDYAGEATDGAADEDWISDCEFEMVQDHPDLIVPFIVAAMDFCETPEDVAWLAAGTIETALAKHGALVIAPLELLATHSAKVRYILSGVWTYGDSFPGEFSIGVAAQASDGAEPAALDEAQAISVLKQRVAEVARALKLGV